MFGAEIPIIQGPMLGASTPAMAIAASTAGAIGAIGAAGLAPAALGQTIGEIREAVGDKPFIVNLFVLDPAAPDPAEVSRAMAALAPWRAELGLPEQAIPNKWAEDFAAQFAVLVETAPPVASFTFGILSAEQCARLKARGTRVVGTATTLAEARAWAAIGADAICASGFESGGHRGTFLRPVEESLVGTLSLVSAVRAQLGLPVIAAGGIADGASIAAVLALGAEAAQMGTAFLLAEESAVSAPWRAALAGQDCDSSRLTRAFSGRYARGIENRFMREMAGAEIPVYPIQNALTQELRAAAARAGRADMLSLWAGQGVHALRPGRTADLITAYWAQARATLADTAARFA
ncbi:NAD(P)H-dependent flavin oxidoreductase [Rhabdaerophilum calidifontis]|uniref:NAD(P)H-dependent flavin oxidoreductase n=1 Tax=Rhabdaerophilum calidifontis TaxID=2604328 RepID=UPI00123BE019|nr:nitronate monooxygenase [Rhabdaerophilum calidifontis]